MVWRDPRVIEFDSDYTAVSNKCLFMFAYSHLCSTSKASACPFSYNASFVITRQMVRRLKWIATGLHFSVITGQFRNTQTITHCTQTHKQSHIAHINPSCPSHVRSLIKVPKLDICSDIKSQQANFCIEKSVTITTVFPKLFERANL